MSTINFNLKNKDQVQIKNEILNKMSKIRESYNIDSNYHELFFNLVQNSNNKNNLKLSINKHGNYSLKTVGGDPSNGNGNATVTGNVNPTNVNVNPTNVNVNPTNVNPTNDNVKKNEESVFSDFQIPSTSNLNPFPDKSKESGDDEEVHEEVHEQEVHEEGSVVHEKEAEGVQGVQGVQGDEEEVEGIGVEGDEEEDEEGDVVPGDGPVEKKVEGEPVEEIVEGEPVEEIIEGQVKNEPEKKKGFFGRYFGFGGQSDSEYESDDSLLSSDDEAEDIIPYTTAVFDDDEDDDMMDHIRNMRSKKYLKNLNNTQLRDILKTNNQKITTGGSYLTKEQMIKSIKKYYK